MTLVGLPQQLGEQVIQAYPLFHVVSVLYVDINISVLHDFQGVLPIGIASSITDGEQCVSAASEGIVDVVRFIELSHGVFRAVIGYGILSLCERVLSISILRVTYKYSGIMSCSFFDWRE